MIEKLQLSEALGNLEDIDSASKLLGLTSGKEAGAISMRVVINKLTEDMAGKDLNTLNTFTIGMAGEGTFVTGDPFTGTTFIRFFLHFELKFNLAFQIAIRSDGFARTRFRINSSTWDVWRQL